MTLSKIAFAVLALGLSFGPAAAEGGEADVRRVTVAPITEGRQATPTIQVGTSQAEQAIIDRNLPDHH